MLRLRIQCAVLVVAVTAAVVIAAAPALPLPADTNGDRKVDVLDLQRFVAKVLLAGVDDTACDVNDDGQVDVLDLQFIVAQAALAPAAAPAPPSRPKAPAAQPLRNPAPPIQLPQRKAQPQPDEEEAPSPFQWSRLEHFVARATQTERYLYTLTPHAPPAHA